MKNQHALKRLQFESFHRRHPEVLTDLVQLVNKVRNRGGKRCSIRLLLEVVRFDRWLAAQSTPDKVPLKLNNNYAPFYSRLLTAQYPEWTDMFQFNSSVADTTKWYKGRQTGNYSRVA